MAAIEINKTVVDAAINDPQVKAKLDAQHLDFMRVWPYVSLGLDISTISAEHMLGFMKSRKAVAALLKREGKEDAAGKLEELEAFVEYSDELNDALRITRSKFTKCGCGDELTDALADRVKNKLSNAEITSLDEAFKDLNFRNALNLEPALVEVWKDIKYLTSFRSDAKFLKIVDKARKSHLPIHLIGEVNNLNKAVGCHLQSAVDGIRVKVLPNPPPLYIGSELKTAKIEINSIPKNALSTFFPSSWNQDRVFEEVANIMKNSANQIGKNPRLYRGIASDGTNIEIRLTGGDVNNLNFDTVFPY